MNWIWGADLRSCDQWSVEHDQTSYNVNKSFIVSKQVRQHMKRKASINRESYQQKLKQYEQIRRSKYRCIIIIDDSHGWLHLPADTVDYKRCQSTHCCRHNSSAWRRNELHSDKTRMWIDTELRRSPDDTRHLHARVECRRHKLFTKNY